jgi:hypothetical protein
VTDKQQWWREECLSISRIQSQCGSGVDALYMSPLADRQCLMSEADGSPLESEVGEQTHVVLLRFSHVMRAC